MANFCGKCGTKLDKQTGLCPKCNRNRISKGSEQNNTMGNSVWIKRSILIVLLFVLICTVYILGNFDTAKLFGFLCSHEWQAATCTSPQTCNLCGETEGEPLGHDWNAATCTTMQACRVCKATKGVPLGHTPGDWSESSDILQAKRHQERTCSVCGSVMETKEQALDSFSDGKLFIFTPREFIERLEHFAKEYYPNFQYEIDSIQADSVDNVLAIRIYLDESHSTEYYLFFNDANGSKITKTDLDTDNILCVSLEKMNIIDLDSGVNLEVIDGDLARAFYQTCDPIISEDDLLTQQVMHLCTFANWMDYNEPVGFSEMNDLLYAFQYAIFKSDEQYTDIQVIQAYATKQGIHE